MTVIAVPEAPPIICPSWCIVTQAEHVAELRAAEGLAIHWARDVKIGDKATASLQHMTYPDGTPYQDEGVTVWIDGVDGGEGLSLAAAEQLAAGIVDLVKEARQ